MDKFTPEQIEDIKRAKSKLAAGLRSKLLDPLITDEIHNLILHNCVLSGGATASILLNETPNDYDLYFKNKEAMATFNKLMEYKSYRAMIKDADAKYGPGHKLVTPRATTLFNDLQVITMMLDEDRVATFDFIHCRPYYDLEEDKLYISPKEYRSIVMKKMIVNNPENLTDKRINKFKERGWTL